MWMTYEVTTKMGRYIVRRYNISDENPGF
jgi:hypothetical protein